MKLKKLQIDTPLFIISALLAVTLVCFLAGLFPYPFGLFILSAALLGRILQIRSSK